MAGNGRGNEFEELMAEVTNIFSGGRGGKGRGGGGGASGSPPGGAQGPELKTLLTVLGAALLAFAAMNSFYTVEEHEEAVLTRFGRYQSSQGPGAHFKIPFADKVYKVSKGVQEHEFGYRKDTRWRAKGSLTEESQMLTGDLNLADVEWMVQYRVIDAKKTLFHVREVDKTIRDVSMSAMRQVVGDKLVGEVLTTGRAEIAQDVRSLMQGTLDEYDIGLEVLLVELQSVDPPDQVKPAYNAVTAAKQEQEQDINQAEREYNKVIPKARGQAAKVLADAEAHAVQVVNTAKGEADYFNALLAAYREAPAITKTRIYLETMEQVLGSTDQFTVVDEDISGLLPVFQNQLKPVQAQKQ